MELSGHIDAGQELQNCISFQLPSDRGVIAVHSAESHYTPGSHHFLVYRTGRQALNDGEDVAHMCTPTEENIHFDGTFYEVQAPDSHRDLPPGIAHLFQPGEVLLLTSHYLNTTENDLDCDVSFTLHTMDPADVQQEAGSIFFYNPAISLPPSSRVTVTRSCPISSDIHLALLWSHMHWRGSTSSPAATIRPPRTRSQRCIRPNRGTSRPRGVSLRPSGHAARGLELDLLVHLRECERPTVVAGQSASTNEMCILHGMYWPRIDPATEECFSGSSTMGDAEALPSGARPAPSAATRPAGAGVSRARLYHLRHAHLRRAAARRQRRRNGQAGDEGAVQAVRAGRLRIRAHLYPERQRGAGSRLAEAKIKSMLQAALQAHMGKPVGVMVRSAAEMADVVKRDPFRTQPANRVLAVFLDAPAAKNALAQLIAPGGEQVRLSGREVFVY